MMRRAANIKDDRREPGPAGSRSPSHAASSGSIGEWALADVKDVRRERAPGQFDAHPPEQSGALGDHVRNRRDGFARKPSADPARIAPDAELPVKILEQGLVAELIEISKS